MKTLFLECNMGAAGDMLMASLLELLPDKQLFIDKMNELGIPGVRIFVEPSVKCGVIGTHIAVTIDGIEEESLDGKHEHKHQHEHDNHHSDMHSIEHVISHLMLSEKVRNDVLTIYNLIAASESHVHGKPVDQIHFHEVGMMDAVADIVGVCLLIEELAPDCVLASPVHVGYGMVHCAHGILPIPAPATAYILQGVPIYGGSVQGELCTPTGAALLKHFVTHFGNMPIMKVSGIGYGMGKKDFEEANCIRALLGETEDKGDQIVELCCNLDDMTPEAIGFAQEQLFEGGALDVYTTALGMKKNRPGVLLSCICCQEKSEKMVPLIFKYTTTLGIREYICNRYTLRRSEKTVQTKYGLVRVKEASGWSVHREKVEYEDIAKIAKENGISFTEAVEATKKAH